MSLHMWLFHFHHSNLTSLFNIFNIKSLCNVKFTVDVTLFFAFFVLIFMSARGDMKILFSKIINILGWPNGTLDLKKGFDKAVKNKPAVSYYLLRIAWKCMKIMLIILTTTWYYRKSLYLSFSNSTAK